MIRYALAASALLCFSCDRYAHGIHKGALADVDKPEIVVYVVEGKPVLSVTNTGRDNACLELGSLTAKIDGAPQTLQFSGGRDSGQTKGSLGPVNKTDWCDAARFTITRTNDVSRASSVVEVTDGATTFRGEYPNIFSITTWKTPPPSTMKAGTTLHAVIAPPPARGVGPYDAVNFIGVSLDDAAGLGKKLTPRVGTDGSIDVDIPATPPGSYTLTVVSSEGLVPAISCSVTACRGASAFVLTAAVTITRNP